MFTLLQRIWRPAPSLAGFHEDSDFVATEFVDGRAADIGAQVFSAEQSDRVMIVLEDRSVEACQRTSGKQRRLQRAHARMLAPARSQRD